MSERGVDMSMVEKYPNEVVRVRVLPEQIDRFNKIIEAYDNLAIVSTVDAAAGELVCWTTEDSRPILLKLLSKMRMNIEVMD